MSKNKKKLAITEFEEDSHAMGLEKDWALPTTVWDAVDAAYNFLSVEYMIRPYSYTGSVRSTIVDSSVESVVAQSNKGSS